MKIKKAGLLKALEAVKPGLSSKDIIEQSTSFAFINGHVTTYNDEIAVRHPVDLDIEGAIRANEFYSLLSKITDETINLEVSDNELLITGKKAKAGIRLEAEVRLPLEELGELEDKWTTLPDGYLKALKMASFCAANDMSKPVLTCVHTKGRYVEASDDFRIMRIDIGKQARKVFRKPLLLPATAIRSLIRYDVTEYSLSAGWAHFRDSAGLVFSCRTFADDFPEVGAFFDVEGPEIKFPPSIKDMLEKAQIFSNGDVTGEDIVKITIGSKQITIKGKGDQGWFEETTKCKYNGDEVNFSISPVFLYDIIDHLRHCIVGESTLKFQGDNFEHIVCLFGE